MDDPLRAAKGIALGLVFSLPLWVCIITVVVLLT